MGECPSCRKGTLRRRRVRESMFGVDLGEFDAEICPSCDETVLGDDAMAQLERRARDAGVWGLGKKL